ncbi:MAG: PAS domain S-box protein [Desulfobacteraceae bacterium]|nr:PAS domain S-box protein [Desulfobacteraceae bacterium]
MMIAIGLAVFFIVYYFGKLRAEISERRQAEAALRSSEQKYSGLLHRLNEAVYRMSIPSGTYEYFSPAAETVFGYEQENFLSTPLFIRKIIHPSSLPWFEQTWGKLLEGQVRPSCEYRIIDSSGNERWIYQTNTAVFDENGKIVALEGCANDVTQRKRAEAALRRSEEKYRSILDSIEEGYFEIDSNSRHTFVNKAMTDITGYSREELLQMGYSKYTDIATAEILDNTCQQIKSDKQMVRDLHIEIITKTGEKKILGISLSPLIDQDGDTFGFRGFFSDITDRITAEAEKTELENRLMQAQKMEAIGTLAGGIAHDFNNILSAVLGYTEISLIEVPNTDPIYGNLQKILSAGERARDLVKQILTFSRQSDHERMPIKVTPIIKETLKLLRASLPTTIEIRHQLNPGLVINSDPTQIHQVMMNLCTNAAHAMQKEGGILSICIDRVQVGAEDLAQHPELMPDTYMKLSVADTGYGMTPVVVERIFDPFFTTKERGKGTGMGLAVVHGIVKTHGGAISVNSEPGEGTTFTIFIPCVESEVIEPSKAPQALPTGDESILFVDDEEYQVDIGKQLLERLGYQVTTRTSGLEALELIRSKPSQFDMVITDMTMPQITGDQLAKSIMDLRTDMPIILCTGYSEKITESQARAIGIREFTMKPLVIRDLAEIVRRVLDEKPATAAEKAEDLNQV